MPANTSTDAPIITIVGEFSDEALEAIARLLIADYFKSQAPATDSPSDAGFNSGAQGVIEHE